MYRSEKELLNLKRTEISEGRWIDAGCGQGAYTMPLSTIVDSVLAIDRNPSNIKHLQNRLKRTAINNVLLQLGDFTDTKIYEKEEIQGVLFAFSLHYQTKLDFLQDIMRLKANNEDFKIVIIEYTRGTPVPWIPYPCPPEKIFNIMSELEGIECIIKFRNARYYILELKKKFHF